MAEAASENVEDGPKKFQLYKYPAMKATMKTEPKDGHGGSKFVLNVRHCPSACSPKQSFASCPPVPHDVSYFF